MTTNFENNRTKELNDLFTEWKSKYFLNEVFYKDGIINEEEYSKAKIKILFVAKEPNGKNHDNYKEPYSDFTDEWNNQIPKYRFAKRIADWSYGILNKFDRYNDEAIQNYYLKKIAFMNIKKSRGTSTTKENEFSNFINEKGEEYLCLIKKQIEIIEPQVVILGLSWKWLIDVCFPNLKWKKENEAFPFAINENIFYVDCYHPSVRIVPKAVCYQKLENTFKSDPFY